MLGQGPVLQKTDHCVCSILPREATDIAVRHTEDHWEVGRECNRQAVAHETRPDLDRVDLSNHHCTNERNSKVSSPKVCAGVAPIRASSGACQDENALEDLAEHLNEQCIEC